MEIYKIPSLQKTHTLTHYQSTVSAACLAKDLVLPKFVHESACYAQVNIQETSSYVVIIEAPYLLGQPAVRTHFKLIINAGLVI